MSRILRFAPLALGLLLLAMFAWRLASPPDSTVRSQLVGRELPSFTLPQAVPSKPPLTSAQLADGKARLLNLFASWCVPCIAEAPMLAELRRRGVTIDAIAIRDRPQDVADFLAENGDPYQRIGSDPNSRVQLALGSSGVPETFVVDGRGIVRFHHVGPIMESDIPLLLAELERAQ